MSKMSNLQVELYSAEKYLMGGVANNITLSGMFIICDSQLVKTGSVVDIKYQLNANGHPHKYSVGALVKEASSDGVMVGFHKFDNNTFCCVRDFILQSAAEREDNAAINSSHIRGGKSGMREADNIESPIKYWNAG